MENKLQKQNTNTNTLERTFKTHLKNNDTNNRKTYKNNRKHIQQQQTHLHQQ